MRSKARPARRKRAPRVPTEPVAEQPPMPQVLTPPKALHELAIVSHRMNQNLLALCALTGQRLKVEQDRLEVERQQLELAREQLALAKAAKSEAETTRAQSEATLARLLEQVLGVLMQRAPVEPRAISLPELEPEERAPGRRGAGLVVGG